MPLHAVPAHGVSAVQGCEVQFPHLVTHQRVSKDNRSTQDLLPLDKRISTPRNWPTVSAADGKNS